jgi:hypothetical protein
MVDNPKYIYIKGHSSLNKDATTVEKKPGVGYVYLAPPGVTCYAGGMRHIKDPETQGVRVLGIDQVLLLWSQISEAEQMNTKNRREFFRILRYLSMDVSGGVPVGQPCIDEQGENQTFSFTGGAGSSGQLGVYDLDLLRSHPGYLSSSWFIDENEFPSYLTLSQIVELVRRKYPSQPLIFLISACRNIVDARGVVRSQGVDEVWTLASEFKSRAKVHQGSWGSESGVSFLDRMQAAFPDFMKQYYRTAGSGVFGDLCDLAFPMDEGSGTESLAKPSISAATAVAAFGSPVADEEKPIIASPERMQFVPPSEDIDTGAGEMEWEGGKIRVKRNRKRSGKTKGKRSGKRSGKTKSNRKIKPKGKRSGKTKSNRSKLRGKSKKKPKKKY